MKHLTILPLLLLVLSALHASAQSELPGDTLRGLPSHYRSYDGFLLDMNSLNLRPTPLPQLDLTSPLLTAPLGGRSSFSTSIFNLKPEKL
jgi:hypothetical protein